jgi:peptidoglycan/LPS O-acetylase OafA/YrhL
MRTVASERVLEEGSNAFGALRLALAALVIVSHSWSLGGFGPEPLLELSRGTTLGFLAVTGFFALSGALVARSAERSTIPRCLAARSRRILPGFWACVVITALAFGWLLCVLQGLDPGIAMTQPPSGSALSWILDHLPLRAEQNRIGTVLAGLPYSGAINGSLWSLPYEFLCYLAILPIVRVWLRTARPRLWLAAVTAASLGLAIAAARPDARFAPLEQPLLVALFGRVDVELASRLWWVLLVGALLALERERVPFTPPLIALATLAFAASVPLGLLHPYGALLVPYLVLGLGRYLPHTLRSVGARNDLSYGLYLYGFPVGQAVVVSALPYRSGLALAAWTLALTVPCAAASWFLFERPFLRRRAGR